MNTKVAGVTTRTGFILPVSDGLLGETGLTDIYCDTQGLLFLWGWSPLIVKVVVSKTSNFYCDGFRAFGGRIISAPI